MVKVYVLCQEKSVSGGPDALHQMVYYLRKFSNVESYIVYFDNKRMTGEVPLPYQKYFNDCYTLASVPITDEDIVIVPESYIGYAKKFHTSKVWIWWLSVDNNLQSPNSVKNNIIYLATFWLRIIRHFDLYKNNLLKGVENVFTKKEYRFLDEVVSGHLCASHYAYDYVSSRTLLPVYRCIEPISSFFLTDYQPQWQTLEHIKKLDIVLYNPVKSGAFVEKLKKQDRKHIYVKLEHMSQSELVEYYKHAKLYIDFGPFPGAERMPKEAVLYDCCILTGRNGASNYYGDVPIKDEYKFGDYENSIQEILDKIEIVLREYSTRVQDFLEYKQMVLGLEENFVESLSQFVGLLNSEV